MDKVDFDRWIAELKDEDNLTVKRKRHLLSIFSDEINQIWRSICIEAGAKLDWWSFSNDEKAFSNDGDGSDGGDFDPIEYEEWVSIIGEWSGNLYRFENGFPTSFLYSDDYQEEVLEALEEDQKAEEEKKEKARLSAKKHKTKKAVLSKLSKLPLDRLQQILEREYSNEA